ncbi:Glycosyltransferase involved in cell wall bisynthesis [Microlunatus sagamiharensis]|uniref:Glycosyltransferase involved in cell wall bisynthesis n=1 Tax=Microlunatus sagamiharensis TaxID=546874 RepID=A0A1H2NA69_9ACTN|nr:glycosyltransferase [Microlunatus sagamiharensis]SDV01706.1 Glycosyltransferase involved in cell wall bisynthesis [Microlunatus sagamiharensis]
MLATYRGRRHLAAQLDSLQRQTRLPDELVVRDDCSDDGTLEELERFASRAAFPVVVLRAPENEGYARNFAAAAAAARGDLLLFCDQDDVWHPEKVETLGAWSALRPGWAYFHDYTLLSTDPGRAAPSCFELLARRGFGPAVSFKGSSMAVARSFLDRWGWPPHGSGISHDFWVALLSTGLDRRVSLLRVLGDHRLHDRNVSGWIASDADRRRFPAGVRASETEVLVDLVVREERLGWTEDFLQVLSGDRPGVRPEAVSRLRDVLVANQRWTTSRG